MGRVAYMGEAVQAPRRKGHQGKEGATHEGQAQVL